MDVRYQAERKTMEMINGYGLGLSKKMSSERRTIIIFIIWVYAFLSSVFMANGASLDLFFVFRGPRNVLKSVETCLKVFSYGVTRANLFSSGTEFTEKFEAVSDEPLFLYFGSGLRRESNVKANIGRIKDRLYRESGDKHECLPLPIIEVETFLPDVGLYRGEYLVINLSGWTLNDSLQVSESNKLENELFVRRMTDWVQQNYNEVKSFILRKRWENRTEPDDLRRKFRIVTSMVAYLLVGTENDERFPILCEGLDSAIECVLNDQDANCSDVLESFKICLRDRLKLTKYQILNRKEVENLNDIKESNVILFDADYYYFSRQFLENCCIGELSRIPFLRILQSLANSGLLKRNERADRDLTCVVNVVGKNGEKNILARKIGIAKEFLEGIVFCRRR